MGKEDQGAKALIDTNVNVYLMPSKLYDAIENSQTTELQQIDQESPCDHSNSIICLGTAEINFLSEQQNFKHKFHVCDNVKLSLGVDFIKRLLKEITQRFGWTCKKPNFD